MSLAHFRTSKFINFFNNVKKNYSSFTMVDENIEFCYDLNLGLVPDLMKGHLTYLTQSER